MGLLGLFILWPFPTMCLIICSGVVSYDPIDNYLIDCGSPVDTFISGRRFTSELSSSLLFSPGPVFVSTSHVPTSIENSLNLQLYQTATIFPKTSRYTFPIRRRGRHWIRLHFFPFTDRNYDMTTASFAVYAQKHLLCDFSPKNNNSIAKTPLLMEFYVNVTSNTLDLTFVPFSHSFAFLSALEVVSAPDDLYTAAQVRSFSSSNFTRLSDLTMEVLYHVNVGGPPVLSDMDPLQRTWKASAEFINWKSTYSNISNLSAVKYVTGGLTRDAAPEDVYGTAVMLNKTNFNQSALFAIWEFNVDPGFQYLVRFHLCVLESLIRDKLGFRIFIDPVFVSRDSDVYNLMTTSVGTPYYFDVVTNIIENSRLCLGISPSQTTSLANPIAIFNGFEVIKLSSFFGDLGKIPKQGQSQSKKVVVIVGPSIAILAFAFSVLAGLFLAKLRLGRKVAQKSHLKAKILPSVKGGVISNSAFRFTLLVVEEATNNFDETYVIGVGGFGKVYIGVLPDGKKAAVKRSNPRSQQGLAEFQTEIELLSQLRHHHLVSLIGYCDEGNEMILIYDYMENGTLKSHLYGSGLPSLSWKQRLETCIGAARGLHYLHTGSLKRVIHRDVKPANILLDENFVAKVADFGLSRMVTVTDQTHVSTAVRGTMGYLDPEYFKMQRLTAKSDVYSFGVVLVEVLCGRPVLDPSLIDDDTNNLAQLAMKQHKQGKLDQIVYPNLVGEIRPDSLLKFAEIAEKCLADSGVHRPSMGEVLFNLEHALQLQLDNANEFMPYVETC